MLDGDGTLWMTEDIFIEGYTRLCADVGVDFADLDYRKIVGRPVVQVLSEIIALRRLNCVPALMYKVWYDLVYGQLLHDAKMREGAAEMLDLFEAEHIQHILVTNAPADHLIHIERVFPRVRRIPRVTRDDVRVPKGLYKPHSPMFLLGAQDMGVDVRRSLMIGDTVNDTKGGRDAGAYVIGTPHEHSPAEDLADAHLLLPDLRDFRLDMIPPLPLSP